MARVVGYARVSNDSQRDNTSLDVQLESIQRYCSQNGHELIGFYEDVESGASMAKRIGLQWALQRLANADALLVYRLDRLTRSVKDSEHIKEIILAQGKLLLSVHDSTDLETDNGEFLYSVMSAINQLERKRILSRAKSGIDKKRNEGRYYGGSPSYGYAALNGCLVELPHEQRIIAEIRDKFFEQGWSVGMIARNLNERGVPSKMRRKWSRDTINRIICGDSQIVRTQRTFGNLLPPEAWHEFANGKEVQPSAPEVIDHKPRKKKHEV